jgi:hypothetical protein
MKVFKHYIHSKKYEVINQNTFQGENPIRGIADWLIINEINTLFSRIAT